MEEGDQKLPRLRLNSISAPMPCSRRARSFNMPSTNPVLSSTRMTPSATPAILIKVRIGRWRIFDKTRLSINRLGRWRLIEICLRQLFCIFQPERFRLQIARVDIKPFIIERQLRRIAVVRAADAHYARPLVIVLGAEFDIICVEDLGRDSALIVEDLLPREARRIGSIKPELPADFRLPLVRRWKFDLRDHIKTPLQT